MLMFLGIFLLIGQCCIMDDINWRNFQYIFLVLMLSLYTLKGMDEIHSNPKIGMVNSVTNLLHNYTLVSTYLYMMEPTPSRPKRKYPDCYFLTLQIKMRIHTFCILKETFVESAIAKGDMTIIVHGDYESKTKKYTLKDLNIPLAHGYDILLPSSSSAVGFIQDGRFYGKLHIKQNTYYLEPIQKFPTIMKTNMLNQHVSTKAALFYEAKDVKLQLGFNNDEVKLDMDLLEMPVNLTQGTKRKVRANDMPYPTGRRIAKGRLCSMLLIADHVFLRDIGAGQVRSTVTQMLLLLAEADAIFRNIDFDNDGLPDNIGFQARYLVVMASPTSSQNRLHWPGSGPVNGRDYLRRVALETPLLGRVCLGAAFTARPFASRALGISFTAPSDALQGSGGLCERPMTTGMSFNVLALTLTMENGERVPWRMATLSLAHELGHSFGSSHDPEGPCSGFLMAANSLKGDERRQYTFSPCSLKQMRRVLQSRGNCLETHNQPYCGNGSASCGRRDCAPSFDAVQQRLAASATTHGGGPEGRKTRKTTGDWVDTPPSCGNGLVEGNEDCDCGLPMECAALDPCCVPRGAKGPTCRVNQNSGYACHPSQGLCCTDQCQHRDVSNLGLDCSSATRQQCPCSSGTSCPCGLLGQCKGQLCVSLECVRLGLTECSCSRGQSHCGTCCLMADGSCLQADQVTRRLLRDGNVTLRSLRRLASPAGPAKTRRVETLCQRGDCLQVEFRVWPTSGFCVAYGALGRCSHSGLCDVSLPLTHPQLRSCTHSSTRAHTLLCVAIALAVIRSCFPL